jgi:hypothetical protein
LRFYEGVGVRVLKMEESEVLKIGESKSELLCTDSTALAVFPFQFRLAYVNEPKVLPAAITTNIHSINRMARRLEGHVGT